MIFFSFPGPIPRGQGPQDRRGREEPETEAARGEGQVQDEAAGQAEETRRGQEAKVRQDPAPKTTTSTTTYITTTFLLQTRGVGQGS